LSNGDCTDTNKPVCDIDNNVCVGCLSNDLFTDDDNPNNDRSSSCSDASRPQCSLFGKSKFTCVVPDPCSTNLDCPNDECCTFEIDTSVAGSCEDLETLRQPHLCAN
jgi:hypothetical protein